MRLHLVDSANETCYRLENGQNGIQNFEYSKKNRGSDLWSKIKFSLLYKNDVDLLLLISQRIMLFGEMRAEWNQMSAAGRARLI
jgi:hypothetical protein